MRVIAGTAKRLQLKCIDGMETRPTTDRIKETLFNIINDDLYNGVFVDLFAGSGGIGIEALSRGAAQAIFVEKNRNAVNIIQENLKHTRLDDRAQIICADVLVAIERLNSLEHIDVIYMDPPYKLGIEPEVLKRLVDLKCIDGDTIIIIEADLKTCFDFISDMPYTIERIKNYKSNKHIFISRK